MSAKAASTGTSTKRVRGQLRPDPGVVRDLPDYGSVLQDPLTFFEKGDLFALGASVINKALESGMNVPALIESFNVPDDIREKLRKGEVSGDLLANWQMAGQDLLRLAPMFPEAVMDLYLLALSIPDDRADEATAALRQIDDDLGFGILETFVEQNGATLADFFTRWAKQFKGATGLLPQTSDATPTSTD